MIPVHARFAVQCVIGAACIAAGVAAGPAASTQPLSATTAPAADAAQKRFVGRLTCGAWVEVLGVSRVPADAKSWWRADGLPLSAPPLLNYFQQPDSFLKPRPGHTAYQIAVRVHWPKPPVGMQYFVRGASSALDEPRVEDPVDHSIISSTVYGTLASPDDPPKIRANVATGEWQTIVRSGADGQRAERDGQSYAISKATASSGVVHFRLSRSGRFDGQDQMIVVDTAGADHQVWPNRTTGGKLLTSEYSVPIPLNNVKELRYDVRPYDQWIEISNLCLDPSHPADVRIATSEDTEGL